MPIPFEASRSKPAPKPSASPTQSIGAETTTYPGHIDDVIGENDKRQGVYGRAEDPAKFLVKLGRFVRPTLSIVGGDEFSWPLGVEGIVISGSATLAEHKYIGDNAIIVQIMHLDDRRVNMTGMFPGVTGAKNVRALLAIIQAETPKGGKVLDLPGVFPKAQFVAIESYNFTHPEEEHTDSWQYDITFRFVGVGKKIKQAKTIKPVGNPTSKKAPAGKGSRVFVVKSGYRTLRAISRKVYGNANAWNSIYQKNKKVLNSLNVTPAQLPTKTLPLGLRLEY